MKTSEKLDTGSEVIVTEAKGPLKRGLGVKLLIVAGFAALGFMAPMGTRIAMRSFKVSVVAEGVEPAVCNPKTPILVTTRNDSDWPVNEVRFTLDIRQPGHSTNQFTSWSPISDDTIVPPHTTHSLCYQGTSVPMPIDKTWYVAVDRTWISF